MIDPVDARMRVTGRYEILAELRREIAQHERALSDDLTRDLIASGMEWAHYTASWLRRKVLPMFGPQWWPLLAEECAAHRPDLLPTLKEWVAARTPSTYEERAALTEKESHEDR